MGNIKRYRPKQQNIVKLQKYLEKVSNKISKKVLL